jgi:DNA-binding CsgD family transcriptional regulator
MSRIQQIREEAAQQERYWHGRKVGAIRLALLEAQSMDMTASEAAKYLGISVMGVYNHCARYKIKLRLAQGHWYPETAGEIEVFSSARETAIRNRGKASASQIANACGITRNSVIGYWNRARAAGLIQ